jgi:DNA-binding NtrC family response regulator
VNVLLVDDEEELVAAIAERLDLRGIGADYVTNGQAAIEKCRDKDYDLVVLDMKMPGLSGLETLEILAGEHLGMPFIMLSGHNEVRECQDTGSSKVCFLVKPAKIDELLDTINELTKA